MRLRRLELQGFKSFVDRTILPFEDGITGVVGPNGCGKSNIVDAIQWVMGEQSAKHLRGDSMSDVIFNGSDTRPATSMAEVSLVMDMTGMNLPPHLLPLVKGEELTITRRLFRDGSAEYLINKTVVRLRDVHEVFMDTGVGRRAYSIIEQGQIDRMINVKPDDRRGIFEEVAGITKYKTKRREAERKLEGTRQNIERVDDIIRELEKQVRSLKIQSTRARKYKEIKGELEYIDSFLLGRRLFDLKQGINELEGEREKVQAEQTELETKYSSTDARITELDVQRIDQEKKVQENEAKERDLVLSVQRLENQIALFHQERVHLRQSLDTLGGEKATLKDEAEQLSQEARTLETQSEEAKASVESFEGEIETLEVSLAALKSEKRQAEAAQEDFRQKISKLSHREVYLENQRQHGELKEREYLSESESLNEKLSELVAAIDSHAKDLTAVDEKVEVCRQKGQSVEQEVAQVHEECQQVSSQLTQAEGQLFERREEFHSKRSRLDSLKELQENFEGYSPTAKEVLLKMGEEASAIPLAELFRPSPEVESLLEALLGDAMNTLVVKTTEEAKRLTQKIESSGLERVSILPVDGLRTGSPSNVPVSLEAILSKIEFDPQYESLAKSWLGEVFLCQSSREGFELRTQYGEASFVTLDGNFISHKDGSLTCGTAPKGKGIFARKREIEQLGQDYQLLEAQVTELDQRREGLLEKLESQEKLHSDLKDKLSSVHIESVELRKEKEKVQLEKDRSDRLYTQLSEESEENSRQLETVRGELTKWKEEQAKLVEDKAATEAELEKLVASQGDQDQAIQQTAGNLNEKNIECSKLKERSAALRENLVKANADLELVKQKEETIGEKEVRANEKLSEIDREETSVNERKESATEERNQLMADLSKAKDVYAETCHHLTELRNEMETGRKRRDEIINQVQELEVRLTQQRSNLEHQQSISLERYQKEASPLDPSAQIDFEQVPLFKGQEDNWYDLPAEEQVILMDEHVENLRKKIGRYGEVNLTAIHEFEEVQKRHDFLLEQKQDLENSIKILEQAITKIDETSKMRFEETFHGVNEKFQEVFPILFNGGKAQLRLTQPDNILESGVDIMAQPPGKRLQSISLLSGGEKALTAVSLVLAIFARKPSPFCLLDEVDAPLDEANVSRFNTVIRRMAIKSQFIVVTHNRKTMDMADALFGVTMEKAGISKMTSVRLN